MPITRPRREALFGEYRTIMPVLFACCLLGFAHVQFVADVTMQERVQDCISGGGGEQRWDASACTALTYPSIRRYGSAGSPSIFIARHYQATAPLAEGCEANVLLRANIPILHASITELNFVPISFRLSVPHRIDEIRAGDKTPKAKQLYCCFPFAYLYYSSLPLTESTSGALKIG